MGDLAAKVFVELFLGEGVWTGFRCSEEELRELRDITENAWLEVLREKVPGKIEEYSEKGISRYHEVYCDVPHAEICPLSSRTFSSKDVERVLASPIFERMGKVLGPFEVSDVKAPYGRLGRPYINWRLVRPGQGRDVGPTHADYWFSIASGEADHYDPDFVHLKVWFALHCEPGLSGLTIIPNSQRQEWCFERERRDGVYKPVMDENVLRGKYKDLDLKPGQLAIFSYNLLHGGLNDNRARRTRVSIELTLEIPRSQVLSHISDRYEAAFPDVELSLRNSQSSVAADGRKELSA